MLTGSQITPGMVLITRCKKGEILFVTSIKNWDYGSVMIHYVDGNGKFGKGVYDRNRDMSKLYEILTG